MTPIPWAPWLTPLGGWAAVVVGLIAAAATLGYVRTQRAKMRGPVSLPPGPTSTTSHNPAEPSKRMPHVKDAARRAVRASLNDARMPLGARAAVFAAALATLLAYEAIHAFVVDVVGLSPAVAVALAGFLEAAAIASALLARDAIRAGRHGRMDLAATWVFAAVSATIAALNELVTTTGWDLSPTTSVAAGFRLAPALVACWLWGRSLHADRADADGTLTLRERRRARRIHLVALAALRVRRLQDAGRRATWAMGRLDRRHATLYRHYPPTIDEAMPDELHAAVSAYGAVDLLPAMTRPTTTTHDAHGGPRAHGWARVLVDVAHQIPRWAPTVPIVGVVAVVGLLTLPTVSAVIVAMGALAVAMVTLWPTVSAHTPTAMVTPTSTPARGTRGHTDAHKLNRRNATVGAHRGRDEKSMGTPTAATTPMDTHGPAPTGEPQGSRWALARTAPPAARKDAHMDAHAAAIAHGLPETYPCQEGVRVVGLNVAELIVAVMVCHAHDGQGSVNDVAAALSRPEGTAKRYLRIARRVLESMSEPVTPVKIAQAIGALLDADHAAVVADEAGAR